MMSRVGSLTMNSQPFCAMWTSATIQIAVSRLVKQFRLASQRCLGMANVAIDVATTIYPFDGETVKDLLLHGRTHWNEVEQ